MSLAHEVTFAIRSSSGSFGICSSSLRCFKKFPFAAHDHAVTALCGHARSRLSALCLCCPVDRPSRARWDKHRGHNRSSRDCGGDACGLVRGTLASAFLVQVQLAIKIYASSFYFFARSALYTLNLLSMALRMVFQDPDLC